MEIKSKPKFSIIIAVLNGALKFKQCLESILNQSYQNFELIIIDGGSIDGTLSILEKYKDRITFWESKHDRGIYHAWNKALKKVSGEWICFLGSDDFFWTDDVLLNMIPHLKNAIKGNLRYVYGYSLIVDNNHQIVDIEGASWDKIKKKYRNISPPLIHQGSFHHINLFNKYGEFDESFEIAGDYEFLMRELKNKNAYFAKDVVICAIGIGGISRNINTLIKTSIETFRVHRRYLKKFPFFAFQKVFQLCSLWGLKYLCGEKFACEVADRIRILKSKKKIWTLK